MPTVTHLDCDTRLRALTPPELTIRGIRYQGQVLSIVEWLPFFERVEGLEGRQNAYVRAVQANADRATRQEPALPVPDAPALREWVMLYRDYLHAVFPRKRRSWLAPDPVKLLETAPDPAASAIAFAHFFDLQSRAYTQRAPDRLEAAPSETATMDGTPSPDGTTPAPSAAPPNDGSG